MKKSICFAHYKKDEEGNDVLLGYRQDTFGTLGKEWAKIYGYSPEQVRIITDSINYTLGEPKPSFFEALKKQGAAVVMGGTIDGAIAHEKKIYEDAQDAGAFEVRVLECPGYPTEREFNIGTAEWEEKTVWTYPKEAMKEWLANPSEHVTLETYYFSKVGKLNLQ